MLFGQIADDRLQFAPYQRFRDKALRIEPGFRIALSAGQEFRRRRDEIMIPSGYRDGRQLEEITRQHDLQSAERAPVVAEDTAYLIDHVEQPRVQHGYFIDDKNVGCLNLAFAPRADSFDKTVGQHVRQSDAAPGMNGRAVDMRRRDAGGRRDGNRRPIRARLTHELVQHIGLAGTRRTGEEHVRTGIENRDGLILPHVQIPFLLFPFKFHARVFLSAASS